EPVSPIKTLAGYTLNNKNPIKDPTTAAHTGEIPLLFPNATTVKKVATITVTLEQRPSNPSVKYTPLSVPNITKIQIVIKIHLRFTFLPSVKGRIISVPNSGYYIQ